MRIYTPTALPYTPRALVTQELFSHVTVDVSADGSILLYSFAVITNLCAQVTEFTSKLQRVKIYVRQCAMQRVGTRGRVKVVPRSVYDIVSYYCLAERFIVFPSAVHVYYYYHHAKRATARRTLIPVPSTGRQRCSEIIFNFFILSPHPLVEYLLVVIVSVPLIYRIYGSRDLRTADNILMFINYTLRVAGRASLGGFKVPDNRQKFEPSKRPLKTYGQGPKRLLL